MRISSVLKANEDFALEAGRHNTLRIAVIRHLQASLLCALSHEELLDLRCLLECNVGEDIYLFLSHEELLDLRCLLECNVGEDIYLFLSHFHHLVQHGCI